MRRALTNWGLIGALLLLSLGLTASCVTPKTSSTTNSSYTGPVSLSALLARPLSWEKLDDLETWLDRYGSSAYGADRNSARLALADGRASFVARDQGKVSAAVLSMRRTAAKDEYQAVLSDPAATVSQRERAQSGIAHLGGVYTGAPKALTAKASGGTSLSIVTRNAWGAAREVPRHMSPHQAPWNVITVHHTAMPLGSNSSLAARSAEMRLIQTAHQNKPEGWGDIGYHFLIDPEGRIFEGRRMEWRGAHVGGQNDHNIGVCLLGNFDEMQPTVAAVASLDRLLDDLCARHGIPQSQVRHHKEWPTANTECPGRNLVPIVERYRRGLTGALSSTPAPRTTKASTPRDSKPTSKGSSGVVH